MVIDPDYLEHLRAQAAEVRADLEERELRGTNGTPPFDDPEADHDFIMQATRPARQRAAMPEIIHKTNENARVLLPDDGNGDDPIIPPTFTEEQLDVLAQVLSQIRMEFQATIDDAIAAATAPLRDRIATLEGSINTLMAMLSDNNRSIEASETIRKLHVQR